MGIDFSQLSWSSLGLTSYEVINRNDFYSLKLKGTSKRLFRIDWTHNNYADHTRLVGYLHGTVNIFGKEATIIQQKINLGTNLIIIPPEINSISSFYLNHYRAFNGKFKLQYYEVTNDVVISSFAEELNNLNIALELINDNLVNLPSATVLQLGNVISNELQLSLAQQEQNLISEFTTLLSSVI